MDNVKSNHIKATPKSAEELSDILKCAYCKEEFSTSPTAEICERTDTPEEILHADCAQQWGIPTKKLQINYTQYLKFDQYYNGLAELCKDKPELQSKLCEKLKIQQPQTKTNTNTQNLETTIKQESVQDLTEEENWALDEKAVIYTIKIAKATAKLAATITVLPWLIADKAYQSKIIKYPLENVLISYLITGASICAKMAYTSEVTDSTHTPTTNAITGGVLGLVGSIMIWILSGKLYRYLHPDSFEDNYFTFKKPFRQYRQQKQ